MRKLTTEEFIAKSISLHGNTYDYSKVDYNSSRSKVCIICSEHGEFWQKANNHLNGQGCPKCSGKYHWTGLEWLDEIYRKFPDTKYDYSKVEYIGNKNKIIIICPVHGEFEQSPNNHLDGHGCPKCIGRNKTTDEIICEFKQVHGDLYDYSNVRYSNKRSKVEIICPIHGSFMMLPNNHLLGGGCPKCVGLYKTTDDIICEFKQVHGGLYDYSNVDYTNTYTKVEIICAIHGSFYQNVHDHLDGHGCPMCNRSKGEIKISEYLDANLISYESQYTFDQCRDKRVLPFDFYIPSNNLLIEYDGIQHFDNSSGWLTDKEFEILKFHDQIKNEFCLSNNVKLLRIPYWEYDNIDNILVENV